MPRSASKRPYTLTESMLHYSTCYRTGTNGRRERDMKLLFMVPTARTVGTLCIKHSLHAVVTRLPDFLCASPQNQTQQYRI